MRGSKWGMKLLCLREHLFREAALLFHSGLTIAIDHQVARIERWQMAQEAVLVVHAKGQIASFPNLENLEPSDRWCPVALRVARLVGSDFCNLRRRVAFGGFCNQSYEVAEQSLFVSSSRIS